MKKFLIGHHGLRGDLAINLPAIKAFANNGNIVDMPINKRFVDMAPLFYNHPHINSIFITDEYENFPSKVDGELLKSKKYDLIGNPMQQHLDDWYRKRHQCSAVMFDYTQGTFELPIEACQIELAQWFNPMFALKHTVCFAPFAGYEHNPNNDKMLSVENAQKTVDFLVKLGYSVIQIGGRGEPVLDNASNPRLSYLDSVRCVLGSKALIHTDTGLGWFISGYKFPQFGIYGHRYYGKDFVKNIQPVNPNAKYVDCEVVKDISLDFLFNNLENFLKNI